MISTQAIENIPHYRRVENRHVFFKAVTFHSAKNASAATARERIEMAMTIPMIEIAMPKSRHPSGLMPPSKRYPRWMEKSGKDLLYMGWGERRFGLEPVPMHSNGGWVYWLVVRGTILIEFEDETKSFQPGTGMLAGPRLAFGFPKVGQESTSILAWIWKSPPPFFQKLESDQYRTLKFSDADIELLDQYHKQCRYESLHADELSANLTEHLRGAVDIIFTRALREKKDEDSGQSRLRIARQWMLDHLEASRPVEDLARYLNVAPITLHRLFKEALGESPGAHFRRLRMERANELIEQERYSLKYIAFTLGYRHAGDFSRAYKQYHGVSVSSRA